MALDHFRGRATFLSAGFQTRVVVAGDDAYCNLLMMGIVADSVELLVPQPPKPHVVVTKSRRMVDLKTEDEPPTVPLPGQGKAEP